MNEIRKFTNNTLGCNIRIVERDGTPWFVANDVSRALGYKNPQEAVRTHCKGVSETLTPSAGGNQQVKIIPEADVYRLVLRSRQPRAEAFQDWIVEEVLPSIRRTGGYLTSAVAAELRDNPAAAAELIDRLVAQTEELAGLRERERVFGNRTPFGKRSVNGLPRTLPRRATLTAPRRINITLDLGGLFDGMDMAGE